MNYNEAIKATEDAENTLRMARIMVEKLLPLLPTRLRTVNDYRALNALCDIKRELRSFNIKTKKFN